MNFNCNFASNSRSSFESKSNFNCRFSLDCKFSSSCKSSFVNRYNFSNNTIGTWDTSKCKVGKYLDKYSENLQILV